MGAWTQELLVSHMFLPGPFRAGDTMAAYNFWSSLSTRKVNEQSSAKNRGYEEEKEEDRFGGRGLPGIPPTASLTQLKSEVQSFMAAALLKKIHLGNYYLVLALMK